jgi:tripartite tricarboxylate transporter family receptor
MANCAMSWSTARFLHIEGRQDRDRELAASLHTIRLHSALGYRPPAPEAKINLTFNVVHIPYKGGGPAVLSGDAHYYFGSIASTVPHIQAGKLRPLAVARSPLLPEMPTLDESGLPGFRWERPLMRRLRTRRALLAT